MLKNIFYAVIFIALVIGLSFALHTYNMQEPYDDTELRAEIEKLHLQVASLASLQERIVALELKLEALADAPTSPEPAPSDSNACLSKALLQALNCKFSAIYHSPHRLITELGLLEDLIQELPFEKDALLREIKLARSETAAQIPSAPERLEIIWKLLLYCP